MRPAREPASAPRASVGAVLAGLGLFMLCGVSNGGRISEELFGPVLTPTREPSTPDPSPVVKSPGRPTLKAYPTELSDTPTKSSAAHDAPSTPKPAKPNRTARPTHVKSTAAATARDAGAVTATESGAFTSTQDRGETVVTPSHGTSGPSGTTPGFNAISGDPRTPAGPLPYQVPTRETTAIEKAKNGFEVRFRGPDGRLLAGNKALTDQYNANPFVHCLRGAGVDVKLFTDMRTGERYVWAARAEPEPGCMSTGNPWHALFDKSEGTVTVDTNRPAPPPPTAPRVPFVGPDDSALNGVKGPILVTRTHKEEQPEPPVTPIDRPPAPTPAPPDPCVPPDTTAAAPWTALGAPACMGSLDYLGCGIRQMGVEVAALAGRFAPLAQQVRAWTGAPPACADPSPIDPLGLDLPTLAKEVAAARRSLGHAQECLKEVDSWLAGSFHCARRDCAAPTDRAALAFLDGGGTLAHQQVLEAAAHLDRLDTTAGAVTRLQQAYRVRCRGAAGREVRE